MVDLFSLASGNTSSSSQSDILVEAYKQTQQSTINTLDQKRADLEKRSVFYTSLNSRISSLVSTLDKFQADGAEDKFVTRSVSNSDPSVISVSADGDAIIGLNTVKVNRLATNDVLITERQNLSDEFGISGSKSFTLEVEDRSFDVSVDFDGTETVEEALRKITDAVNDLEYEDEDGDNQNITLSASLIKDTNTTGRITFTSKEAGSLNQIKITSGDNDLMKELGLNTIVAGNNDKRTLSSGGGAGYLKKDITDLDSNVTINGIEVTRSSNSLDDVLPGLSISLLKPQSEEDQAVTMQTEVGTDKVEDFIQPLLDNINNILSYLSQDKTLLRSESAPNTLFYQLRSLYSEKVEGIDDADPQYLSGIGIKFDNQKLYIDDAETLTDLLKEDPTKVSNLFLGENGIVNKLDNMFADMQGSDGLILSKTRSLQDRITLNKQKVTDTEERISRQADALRRQYEDMLEVYYNAESQYSQFMSYTS